MSQVVKAIIAHDTGNRKVLNDSFTPLFTDVFSVKSESHENRVEFAKVYRIGVTIGSQVMVSDANADTLGEAIMQTKQQVIEAIFGEFRQDFMMVERALYDRDFQKSRDYLRILEEKMFSTK